MDDVAKEAGISKKTLYSCFNNKNHLLEAIIEQFLQAHHADVSAIRERSANAIDEYYEISKLVITTFREIQPSMLYDMKKFHPAQWKLVENFQNETVAVSVRENLERGIKEGLYRSCMNVDLISRIYTNSINNILNKDLFMESDYTFEQIYREFFIYHASGICSEKGKEYLNQIANRDKNN